MMFPSLGAVKPTLPYAAIYEVKRGGGPNDKPELKLLSDAQTLPSGAAVALSGVKMDDRLVPFLVRKMTAEDLETKFATKNKPLVTETLLEDFKYVIHGYSENPNFMFTLVTLDTYSVQNARLGLLLIAKKFFSQGGQLPHPAPGAFNTELAALKKSFADEKEMNLMKTLAITQGELDETKEALNKTVEQVLRRGDHIDKLVEKSGELTESTKMFYTETKAKNACCVVM